MTNERKFYAMTIVVEVDTEDHDIRRMIADHKTDDAMKDTLAYNIEWTLQEEFKGGIRAVHLAS